MRRVIPTAALVAAGLALLMPLAVHATPCTAAPPPPDEEFHYRWHLGSFLGRIAGLFLPSRGDGVLTLAPAGDGRLRSELLITSEESRDGEFWRYGAELDRDSGRTLEAWSAYRWRGESKEKQAEIEDQGVMEVVSGIYAIRRDPPRTPRRMEIWSDGKVYPVVVIPVGEEKRRVGDREVATRHFSIRGYEVPGKRQWKGSLELWLAEDEAATPVEIRIERKFADLRLELQPEH